MLWVAVGFLLPKFFDPFVPVEKRGRGHLDFAPNETIAVIDTHRDRGIEEDGVMRFGGNLAEEPVGFEGKGMSR